ncbi:hypothetical protein IPZ58_07695 [Streptomyces roseoverticillatus]|nr:hypothetical protein [Streptomyces roseoverticillatus]MCF3101462.1 hypothetical protein [Streptomyces roseoverticillatus]
MATVSFYGYGYCADCDTTWEFAPVDDGTVLESDHRCEREENDSEATR